MSSPPVRITVARLLGGAAVGLLAVVAAVGGWRIGQRFEPEARHAGGYPELLTAFRLPSLDGRQLGPGDFEGRAVLIEFWATWCGPCHVQAKILASLYRELAEESVEFLAVSVGEDETTVRSFVEETPFPYPVLLDSRSTLVDEAQIYALPTLVVIDRRGEVVYLRQGISNRKTLEQVLGQALAPPLAEQAATG